MHRDALRGARGRRLAPGAAHRGAPARRRRPRDRLTLGAVRPVHLASGHDWHLARLPHPPDSAARDRRRCERALACARARDLLPQLRLDAAPRPRERPPVDSLAPHDRDREDALSDRGQLDSLRSGRPDPGAPGGVRDGPRIGAAPAVARRSGGGAPARVHIARGGEPAARCRGGETAPHVARRSRLAARARYLRRGGGDRRRRDADRRRGRNRARRGTRRAGRIRRRPGTRPLGTCGHGAPRRARPRPGRDPADHNGTAVAVGAYRRGQGDDRRRRRGRRSRRDRDRGHPGPGDHEHACLGQRCGPLPAPAAGPRRARRRGRRRAPPRPGAPRR